MTPKTPGFVQFLIQYQSIAINQISRARTQNGMLRSGMSIFFQTEYGKFLREIGVPLSCISFYSGGSDGSSIQQLQKLSNSLRKKYSRDSKGQSISSLKFTSLTGKDIEEKLSLSSGTGAFKDDFTSELPNTEKCNKMFWTCNDSRFFRMIDYED